MGFDISLIHEAYLENKNLSRIDPIVIFGVTTHSIKTKYGVVTEMFGKTHVFHVLDNNSPVKHQGILGIDFLTNNNFTFSNKSLTLNKKEFKKCDKPHNDTKEKNVLVVSKNDTGAIIRIGDSNKPILPKYLYSEIKSIEDFHNVPVYSITKENLNNTRLQLLKENTRLSHISEHSKSGIS